MKTHLTAEQYFSQEECPMTEEELLALQESQFNETSNIRYVIKESRYLSVPVELTHESLSDEIIAEWIAKWHERKADAEDIEIMDILPE